MRPTSPQHQDPSARTAEPTADSFAHLREDEPRDTDAAAGLRARADAVLRRLVGDGEGEGGRVRLRTDQWRAIEALAVHRRRTLVVQRTGWGKSAVYFVVTALLREQSSGPTLIVSPLLALMRNQIAAAERAGIRAYTINSGNPEEWESVRAAVAEGNADVLLVSPERLNSRSFREEMLPGLARTTGLLVVDEAHCISDWGHDFRPDYRRLRTVLTGLRPGVPVLATTATANARVTADVAEQLAAGEGTDQVLVLRGPLERESLRLSVLRLPDVAHRLAWLDSHLAELPGSGIVYTLTVAAAEEVAAFLRARGHDVAAYTGRTDIAERQAAEDGLLANELKALVATSALGMGFDKPDLGFVVHVGSPSSPIAYYQQIGRAGRAIGQAEAVLLPGPEDEAIWRYFASLAFPPEEQVRRTLRALERTGRAMSLPALEPLVELRRSRLEMMLKVLDVDGAVRRESGGWVSTGQPWEYDADRYDRVARQRAHEQQAMRAYTTTSGCRMEFLRRELDDPEAAPCGRCDRCAGSRYGPVPAPGALAAARGALARPGVPLEPRRMWPSGLSAVGLDLRGRLPAGEQAAQGRALGRLSDLSWGNRLRPLLSPGAVDGPVPDDVFDAVVAVLTAWAAEPGGWATPGPGARDRPVGVVVIDSRTRSRLVHSLGQRLARVGRLPLLGTVRPTGEAAPASRSNGAQRVRALHGSLELPAPLADAVAAAPGPVLLVDDYTESGWTLAMAARLLRGAGAREVLPLVLAVQG